MQIYFAKVARNNYGTFYKINKQEWQCQDNFISYNTTYYNKTKKLEYD